MKKAGATQAAAFPVILGAGQPAFPVILGAGQPALTRLNWGGRCSR